MGVLTCLRYRLRHVQIRFQSVGGKCVRAGGVHTYPKGVTYFFEVRNKNAEKENGARERRDKSSDGSYHTFTYHVVRLLRKR